MESEDDGGTLLQNLQSILENQVSCDINMPDMSIQKTRSSDSDLLLPIGSMYGIFPYIFHSKNQPFAIKALVDWIIQGVILPSYML